MQLCSLSVAYAGPFHNPTNSMVHNVDISKPLAHMMHSTVETGIHPGRAHLSSVPVAIEGEHLPTEVGYGAELVKNLVSTQMSFPEMVSDCLCRNSSVVQTHNFISLPDGWSQTTRR